MSSASITGILKSAYQAAVDARQRQADVYVRNLANRNAAAHRRISAGTGR